MTQLKSSATLALMVVLSLGMTGCGTVGGWVGLGDEKPETAAPAAPAEAPMAQPEPEPEPVTAPEPAPMEAAPAEPGPMPELTLPPTEPVPFEEPQAPMAAPPAPADPQIYEVMVPEGGYLFVPREITIYEGDTVVWKNTSGIVHLFASIPGADASGRMEIEPVDLLVDGDISHTFAVAGSYPYFCFIHNRMTGKINVLPR